MTRLAGAVLVAGGLLVTAAGVANAAAPVVADPVGPEALVVNDFATYPTIVPPAGCSEGPGFVTGLAFDVIRGPAGIAAGVSDVTGATTLRETGDIGRLYPGDKLIAHWTGFSGGANCDAELIGVSLALKESHSPSFDPQDQQLLLRDFAYCGSPVIDGQEVGATSCAAAKNTLTLTMPTGNVACFYQVDLVIGGPLAQVGPGGSYYSQQTRASNGKASGPNMLIDANNGGAVCEVTTTTGATTTGATTTAATTTTGATTTAATTTTGATTTAATTTTGATTTAATTTTGATTTAATTTTGATTTAATTTTGATTTAATTTTGATTTAATTTTGATTTAATTTTGATTTVVNTTQETSTTLATTTTGATTTAATTTTGATTTVNSGTPPPDVTVEGTTVTNPQTLPVTGSSTWPAARIGILMVIAGVAALAFGKRRGERA